MRQEALRNYLRELAKDLILRGLLRHQQGQTIVDMLKQEPSLVIGSIVRDLKDAGLSVGQEIVGGAVQSLLGAVFRRGAG